MNDEIFVGSCPHCGDVVEFDIPSYDDNGDIIETFGCVSGCNMSEEEHRESFENSTVYKLAEYYDL